MGLKDNSWLHAEWIQGMRIALFGTPHERAMRSVNRGHVSKAFTPEAGTQAREFSHETQARVYDGGRVHDAPERGRS